MYSKENNTPQSQLDLIKKEFNSNTLLVNNFDSINVSHSNNLATLVPKPFFNEAHLSDYLQYNVKVLKNDFIAFDTLEENADTVNVYIPFVHINNYLFDKFGSFEYKHSSTVLIETLLRDAISVNKTLFFVNVEKEFFQILILKNKKIEFFNTFNYKTKEDFIYFILFVTEQLYLNTEKIELAFLGAIDKQSELYKITYQYIKNIQFFEPKYTIPEEFELPNHSFFTLLNQI